MRPPLFEVRTTNFIIAERKTTFKRRNWDTHIIYTSVLTLKRKIIRKVLSYICFTCFVEILRCFLCILKHTYINVREFPLCLAVHEDYNKIILISEQI